MLFKLSTQYCFRCSSAYNYVLVVHLLLKVRVVRREKSYILFISLDCLPLHISFLIT